MLYTRICIRMYACMYISALCILCIYVYVYMHVYVYLYICMSTYMHAFYQFCPG